MSKNAVYYTVILICLFAGACLAKYSGGTGEPNDPYLIATPNDLNAIGTDANVLDKHFKLVADIDLAELQPENFNIIGTGVDNFTGDFDGNDHQILNLHIDSNETDFVGLFGYVYGGKENHGVRNLTLVNPDVNAGNGGHVGSLIGLLSYGSVKNCRVQNASVTAGDMVGGLVGRITGSTSHGNGIFQCHVSGRVSGGGYTGGLSGLVSNVDVQRCSAQGIISGASIVGGLAGLCSAQQVYQSWTHCDVRNAGVSSGGLIGIQSSGKVVECYSLGSVYGYWKVGGLIGSADSSAYVNYCYSNSSVTGDELTGGLIGNSGMRKGRILHCYSSGVVDANSRSGGFVGNGYSDGAETCFWDVNTSGWTTSAGGTAKTTAQMQQAVTFLPWACEGLWKIDDGHDYPRFIYEPSPGQPIELPAYGGGSGEPDDPFLIFTAEQLNTVGLLPCHFDRHFRLMNDIDLAGYDGRNGRPPFNMIAKSWKSPFTGTFDGGGHSAINLTIEASGNYVGLFHHLRGDNALISNLKLVEPQIAAQGASYVGALVGGAEFAEIRQCGVLGGSVTGRYYVGGLIGQGYNARLSADFSTAEVHGDNDVGGIAGALRGGYEPYSVGAINCYAQGPVVGRDRVGGLVGSAHSDIVRCYTSGSISGYSEVGGLVGVQESTSLIYDSSFWNASVNPSLKGVGSIVLDPCGVIGQTTENMQQAGTYLNAGWDFIGETTNGYEDIWRMCVDGVDYPRLFWEFSDYGDLICPDGVDFTDYSVLADQWLLEKLNADMTNDGHVNLHDFAAWANQWQGDYSLLTDLSQNWLARSAGIADIAPASGDDFVDWHDLAVLTAHWLY